MIFKHFCAVFFSPTDDLNIEVDKISEGKVRLMSGKNISIFTFSTILDTYSLTDYFKSLDRNFLLFKLDNESSGFSFNDKDKENDLFGFLKDKKNDNNLENLSNSLLDNFLNDSLSSYNVIPDIPTPISGSVFNMNKEIEVKNDKEINYDYSNMTKTEINKEIDKLIDKGVDNLTEIDKKTLQKLSNLM
jgi:hypothetical protein